MRIVIWNCAMGLHTKWDRLLQLRPDVAIIPECANPDILWSRRRCEPQCDVQWIGSNPHKGLGVFAFAGFSLHRDKRHTNQFEQFVPLHVSGKTNFSLLGVWAFNGRSKGDATSYGAGTVSAIDYYQDFIRTGSAVVAGDFNNSTVWDLEGKTNNFATIASRLDDLGLTSAYHGYSEVPFGSEPGKTLFFRKGALEYHID